MGLFFYHAVPTFSCCWCIFLDCIFCLLDILSQVKLFSFPHHVSILPYIQSFNVLFLSFWTVQLILFNGDFWQKCIYLLLRRISLIVWIEASLLVVLSFINWQTVHMSLDTDNLTSFLKTLLGNLDNMLWYSNAFFIDSFTHFKLNEFQRQIKVCRFFAISDHLAS